LNHQEDSALHGVQPQFKGINFVQICCVQNKAPNARAVCITTKAFGHTMVFNFPEDLVAKRVEYMAKYTY
jgi:hypothetical protein